MSNKAYNICKWVLLIVIPAVITFMGTIGATFSIEWMPTAIAILTAAETMFGSILQISSNYYHKSEDDKPAEVTISVTPDGIATDVHVDDYIADRLSKGESVDEKLTCVIRK